MYTRMFQNSYVVMAITFILLSVIFYLFEIGYSTSIQYSGDPQCLEKGNCTQIKVLKKFSWKYPLAISLIVWLVWHFYLYPPEDLTADVKTDAPVKRATQVEYAVPISSETNLRISKGSEVNGQKINMINWN